MSHKCALKLTDLWKTSLLFYLSYKFELIGVSLLALAKSLYYWITKQRLVTRYCKRKCSKQSKAKLCRKSMDLRNKSTDTSSQSKEVGMSTMLCTKCCKFDNDHPKKCCYYSYISFQAKLATYSLFTPNLSIVTIINIVCFLSWRLS